MSELIISFLKDILSQAKPIFLRWERLRILYNLVLLGISLLAYTGRGSDLVSPFSLGVCLVGALLSNLCYLAGPLTESYFHWLGLRSRWVTALVFITGCLVSVPLVFFFLMGASLTAWEMG